MTNLMKQKVKVKVKAREKKKVKVKIANLVYQIRFKNKFDMDKLRESFLDIDKIKGNFPGLKVKLKDPKCTILFFVNGVIHVTGLKNSKHIVEVEKIIKSKFESIGIEYKVESEPIIINSLAVGEYGDTLDLNKISVTWKNTIYEPELFPGLIYRVYEPVRATFLIFSSGKFVVLGVSDLSLLPAIIKENLDFNDYIKS